MAAFTLAVDAHCPLCRASILHLVRRVPCYLRICIPCPCASNRPGEGYMLCDDCGVLADLPQNSTLN